MSSSISRIAVLMGGPSAEREVSLVSGRECATALRAEGFDVTEIDAGETLIEDLRRARPDVVFNALHGRWGEDGCVQGILEWLRIPYTHSGVLASATAMDKLRSKAIYAAAGLPVARDMRVLKSALAQGHPMDVPYVVKPYNEGSSVGISIVTDMANGPVLTPDMPEDLMAEEYIPGRELTVSVMGDRALCVTDIVATSGWYDFDAKYSDGGSTHILPADLPEGITAACLDYALRAHSALGCRGLSRTDFRWDEARGLNGLFLLETNTQPGMTPTSLSPEQAAHCGLPFGKLLRWMVEDASCNR